MRTARGNSQFKNDKLGRLGYLDKMDVTRMARVNTAAVLRQFAGRDVRYTPGEVQRQFRKSTSSMRMRKAAEIQNYSQAENAVLKRQMQMIKSFDALPNLAALNRRDEL